jgi:toxin ParE1/3/4
MAQILLDSNRTWGEQAADRYRRLMLAGMQAVEDAPRRPGSHEVAGITGVHVFALRLVRLRVAREHRVGQPRHLIVYRLAPDGIADILGFAHDRMELDRAARQMLRAADL